MVDILATVDECEALHGSSSTHDAPEIGDILREVDAALAPAPEPDHSPIGVLLSVVDAALAPAPDRYVQRGSKLLKFARLSKKVHALERGPMIALHVAEEIDRFLFFGSRP